MKRDEERARKMWRDIGVAAMQHGPNSLHHHQPAMYGAGVGNGSAATLPNNPHWNQPGYRNSYSLPHPSSQNGGGERNGGGGGGGGVRRGDPGGDPGGRYPHYDIKPLSQAPSFPEISSASYTGNGYHHPAHHHHAPPHLLPPQGGGQQHPHGMKPPRPLSMYELHHNGGGSSPQQLHSLPPNFVPHQQRAPNGRSPSLANGGPNGHHQHGMGPRSPTAYDGGGGGGGGAGRTLLQQPEELVSWKVSPSGLIGSSMARGACRGSGDAGFKIPPRNEKTNSKGLVRS
ncbi:hypothetical protein ZHAS_00002622 [Anopheles sinensis]|uniref:Uncharacterized protein n=1 Tax=Anopheles sinensis TaxID=74873 RepID=A0A084VCL2_ANOSI|nr:hypothetical protein ZHAS_00002622 [Anopheles sinensis]